MNECYIALGSNLGQPLRHLRRAIVAIKALPKTNVIKASSILKTKALGSSFQPMYGNQVIVIQTNLTPQQLLKYCQQVEKRLGRVRKKRWGSRTIDLDIVLYGNRTINTPTLTIPHKEMKSREFVMQPLMEVQHRG
jgi:2-amino-4-hydroxy-6-hydroxymethyldihydropteridine diphosphokinase